ncbi:MAG: hypothetical protein HYS25_05175 [Ignavibacteriales bacterium]|nr:hypothetical protein [Ignavibacteriales bacterium]
MKKFLYLSLLTAFAFKLNAQNLDSLYNEFIKIRLGTEAIGVAAAIEEELVKCGFGIANEVKLNYDKFDPKQKKVLSSLLTRPQSQKSFVSPSGFFRIHYDTIGTNKPGYDLNQLAAAFDSSYNFEVNILGYPSPPKDNGQGGDDKYDVYIANLAASYYGNTYNEDPLTAETYTSYIEIDNDFSSTYTHGIEAARVTAAHEFHHAIQMGNYVFRNADSFYHEITSTAMEEFVFDDVNDYYGYLKSFFDKTYETMIDQYGGYNLAIWNIFLKDRFGFDILKRIWELMRTERALYAIRDAIAEYSSTFKAEFNTFGQWLYFTKERAQAGKYFEEAANYPKVKPTIELTLPQQSMEISTEPVSTNFLFYYNNTGQGIDTLITIITNADVTNGVAKPDSLTKLSYAVSTQDGSGYKQIFEGYYSKLESEFPLRLVESNILNKSAGQGHFATVDYAFPQPFKYSNDGFIYFPADGVSTSADIYIYSVDMNLVFSGSQTVDHNNMTVSWNVLDKSGNRLGTGVYFYYVKTDTLNKKGKFVILND